MHIGHINLSETFNGAGEHFVRLIESLRHHSVTQHVVVRNITLAKRLDAVDGVTVGPVTRSTISAFCLMPAIDVVHIHDHASASAGLLFTLTRAVPFVLTRHVTLDARRQPLNQVARRRAAGFIDQDQIDVDSHLELYRHALGTSHLANLIV